MPRKKCYKRTEVIFNHEMIAPSLMSGKDI